jgi:hypothetical protein
MAMTRLHVARLSDIRAMRAWGAGVALLAVACGGNPSDPTPIPPPPIVVAAEIPVVSQQVSQPLDAAASYAWSTLIALHWPASTAANTRGVPDTSRYFGDPGTPVWITMRSKVEVYPGNGSATIAPHGIVLDPDTHQPKNDPDDVYGNPPQYLYKPGALPPCQGQAAVPSPALIVLDETTQINNNQTFAGAAPATDPRRFNSKPQLIRYAVKMNGPIFARAVNGGYWYAGDGSPLDAAQDNYTAALSGGTTANPAMPYVNLASTDPKADPRLSGIEIKSAWRPLSEREARSGRFLTAMVRYYEQPDGKASCYREAVWGLVGMHLISFPVEAPWVIWATFEQADNILTADGRPTEDVNGKRLIDFPTPTTPMLSSNPDIVNPTVTAKGDYCASPGSRLYFQENPNYGTLPSGGNICVNTRWSSPEPIFINANVEAHGAIASYLKAHGQNSSPLMFYKLVGAQGVPVDFSERNDGAFSTFTSYQSANAVIETDYSLGNFSGNLRNGVPSNVLLKPNTPEPYVNTRLLPFQSTGLDLGKKKMGGCAGCHGFAAQMGNDLSFALGNNVEEPEHTDAFASDNRRRNYFPRR